MLRLLALLLLASPLAAADPVPEPRRVPDVAAFPKAFAAAVGEHFEYLGGEPVRIRASMGTYAAERFWLAKVKPKAAGQYVFTYGATFHFPEIVTKKWGKGGTVEYTFRIAVGKVGEARVFHPGGYGGAAFPHLNVGDTLLIPIHCDPFRVDHQFDPVKKVPDDDPIFRIIGERADARYLKDAAAPPVVTNAAPDRLKLLASWTSSFGNRPGTRTSHSNGAYLEFTAAGEYNLSGRLTDAKATEPGVPFRVLAKDAVATVLMEYVGYVEKNGMYKTSQTSAVRHGTLEARVGDRVAVGAGGYGTPGLTPADPRKTGVVETLPFRDLPAYQPR